MREIITMWKYTKMVVLCAITAAIFAAILIPMKSIPLIPGSTEIRPASVIPVVFGILFGPAGAWGSAIGNLIGDFFGTLGIGTIFGLAGNFFFSLTAYKLIDAREIYHNYRQKQSKITFCSFFLYVGIVSSAACASFIAWGLDILGLVPFSVLGSIIFINNLIVSVVLGPLVFLVLYPRIERWDMLWTDILKTSDFNKCTGSKTSKALIIAGSLGAFAIGIMVSSGLSGTIPFLPENSWIFEHGTGISVLPFLILIIAGCIMP